MSWSSSILPLSSPKSALLPKGLLNRAILCNFDFASVLPRFPSSNQVQFSRLVERAIRHDRKTCSEIIALVREYDITPSATSRFMTWLEQWLRRMVYRDENPFSRDICAMGRALAVYLYRCADAHDYQVSEQLVLRRADLEQRWESATALMHVAVDAHNGIEDCNGSGSRVRMLELLLFHGANVHARLDNKYWPFNGIVFMMSLMHVSEPVKRLSCWLRKKIALILCARSCFMGLMWTLFPGEQHVCPPGLAH
jgi:hypothetical protein